MSSYATVAQLSQYLKQTSLTAENFDLFQTVLDRATAIVDEALGFAAVGGAFGAFSTGTGAISTEDVRAEGSEWLILPAHQQASVSAVSEVYSKGSTSETTHTVTDWVEEARPVSPIARLYRGGGWGDGAWYRVSAVWGFGPAPASIAEVTLEIAVNLWRSKDAGRFSAVVGVEGGGAVGYEKALTPQQQIVIDKVAARLGFGGVW